MDITTERFDADGVGLQVTRAGEGPLVVLLHGFPELAYSWRHQITALAEAGYSVIAPDMRGYGASDAPEAVTDYDIFNLTGDVTALIRHYGAGQPAVVVGHDWGAMVAWAFAGFRPDLVRGVVGMSVPYTPRLDMSLLEMIRAAVPEGDFNYILHFQQPDVAEAELEADPIETMRHVMWMASGDAAKERAARADTDPPKPDRFLFGAVPAGLPPWLSEGDLEAYARGFARSGFTGGINWYRNLQRNWELTRPWHFVPITVPATFIAGRLDPVLTGQGPAEESPMVAGQEFFLADNRGSTFIDDAGHWVQQEAPEETNAALLAFIAGLD